MALANLIEKGGVYRDIKGGNIREALSSFIYALKPSSAMDKEKLLKAILEREALMSTGIGNGIAIPHPRNPIAMEESEQFVALAYLEKKVNWNALDENHVDTLMLIVSASAKTHLRTLSEITYFSRQAGFVSLLRAQAPLEELQKFIREAEKTWN